MVDETPSEQAEEPASEADDLAGDDWQDEEGADAALGGALSEDSPTATPSMRKATRRSANAQ